jgi:hypothetical protein
MMTSNDLTDKILLALRNEAAVAGDQKTFADCSILLSLYERDWPADVVERVLNVLNQVADWKDA